MYLRMTSLGPVRVQLPDLQHPVGGPYKVAPNPQTLLDATDLVFIDAPGTGYSRVEGKDAAKSFYGVDQDAAAFDRFIRRFLSKYDRWTSPRFLFGESYGTTRDAVLGAKLQQHGVDLNGIVFLSQILSFSDSADGSDSDPVTKKASFSPSPSFAATAWYHHKVPNQPAQLEPWLHEVEQFSTGEYATALTEGADLDPRQKTGRRRQTRKLHRHPLCPVDQGQPPTQRRRIRQIPPGPLRHHHRPPRFALRRPLHGPTRRPIPVRPLHRLRRIQHRRRHEQLRPRDPALRPRDDLQAPFGRRPGR